MNTDSKQVQLNQFESHLQAQISQPLLESYGIRLAYIGTERLTLPAVLNATVDRMRAEREKPSPLSAPQKVNVPPLKFARQLSGRPHCCARRRRFRRQDIEVGSRGTGGRNLWQGLRQLASVV